MSMYLMYVDESGNCGLNDVQSRYFVLTGLVIHDSRWNVYLNQLINFRKDIRKQYGLKLKEEIHASDFVNNTPDELLRIPRKDRWTILQKFGWLLSSMADFRIINIVVDKNAKDPDFNVFEIAWQRIIQRYANTIERGNFPGPNNTQEFGLILPDNTDKNKLKRLLRKMRRVNIIPHSKDWKTTHTHDDNYRDLPLPNIIEDPIFKDSYDSYYIQAVDLCAYLMYQSLAPNQYMRRAKRNEFFNVLSPILCTQASRNDPLGIVRI